MKDNVRNAARNQRDELMNKKNVVGVMSGNETKGGIKTGREAVVVLVRKKERIDQLNTKDIVPSALSENSETIPTDVVEVGDIKAFHTNRHRPVLPGTSIGHFGITAGTFGVVVQKSNGQKFILSNNHVLANENNASVGDAILQPGPADGGTEIDKVGELSSFVPINFDGSNLVDAALAKFNGDPSESPDNPDKPDKPDADENSDCPIAGLIVNVLNLSALLVGSQTRIKSVRSRDFTEKRAIEGEVYINKPLNLGSITRQLSTVNVGDGVKKSGRTTGVTVDEVIGIDAAVNVEYNKGVAHFVDQIICGPMSAGGDSGSVVYDSSGNAIGLLFAGSDTVTIVNRIQDVFAELDIEKIA